MVEGFKLTPEPVLQVVTLAMDHLGFEEKKLNLHGVIVMQFRVEQFSRHFVRSHRIKLATNIHFDLNHRIQFYYKNIQVRLEYTF